MSRQHEEHDVIRLSNHPRGIVRRFCVTCGIDLGPAAICGHMTKKGRTCFQPTILVLKIPACRYHQPTVAQ